MAESNITKKALANALKELMIEKSFSKISVADICEKCDMNRKSFYYHFKDKYDLVNWIFDTEFISILKSHESNDIMSRIYMMAEYFYENRNFYKKALSIEGQNSFSEHFYELIFVGISARIKEDFSSEELNSFQVSFFSDAIVMSFRRWITEKDCSRPEKLISELKLCMKFIATAYDKIKTEPSD